MLRALPKRPVPVRNKVIGGSEPLVCIPLLAREVEELVTQTAHGLASAPDLLEWRADGFAHIAEPAEVTGALQQLGQAAGDTPLIFTCRSAAEGGLVELPDKTRQRLCLLAMGTGVPALVDVELASPPGIIDEIVTTAHRSGVSVILSFHDFRCTPPEKEIIEHLFLMQNHGADVAKVAVMPADQRDILRLFQAAVNARASGLEIPIIAIAMGAQGAISRLAGWLFGSDVTFAAAVRSSAPGQMPVQLVRRAIALLHEAGY